MIRDRVSATVDGKVQNVTFPSASASTRNVVVMARAPRARVSALWATKDRTALRVSVCGSVALCRHSQWFNYTLRGVIAIFCPCGYFP